MCKSDIGGFVEIRATLSVLHRTLPSNRRSPVRPIRQQRDPSGNLTTFVRTTQANAMGFVPNTLSNAGSSIGNPLSPNNCAVGHSFANAPSIAKITVFCPAQAKANARLGALVTN